MKLDIEILHRYLDGKATAEECKQVLTWLSTEESKAEVSLLLDKDIQMLTNESADTTLDHAIRSDRMKKRFMRNIHLVHKWNTWLKIAAVVVPFVILLGSVYLLADRLGVFADPEYALIEVPCGEQKQIVLQDGTQIQLNSSSSIRFPKKMGLFSRKVKLSGEAYFNVAKDAERPFIVDLNGVSVRVTGTQFNVKAYPQESYVQVMLNEGGVLLEDNADRKFSLRPGECAGYNRNTGHCDISQVKDEHFITGWRSRSLNFYHTPFGEILKTLERQYDVTFQVTDKKLLDVHFTLSTNKVRISDILDDLTAVSKINFVNQGTNGKVFIVTSKEK